MLAFVHIEKSAGTTLKSIFQQNFGPGFAEVRPLFPTAQNDFDPEDRQAYNHIVQDGANPRQFGPRDLTTYRYLNPWLSCFSGHSIRPCLGLEKSVPELRYITILREPGRRYVSYYNYTHGPNNPRKIKKITFEEFLEKKHFHNFQTKKIACRDDLHAAQDVLDRKFMLVGVMEEFDEFLIMLKQKLGSKTFTINYRALNTRPAPSTDYFKQYREQIEENNKLDITLYHYVLDTILPRQRIDYGPDLESDVARFKSANQFSKDRKPFRALLQKAFQRVYLDTAAGLIRRRSGFPWGGTY
jgi:hypothetical protein